MIAFLPSNAGKASSRWYVRSFNSAFLSSTTKGDIIRSLLPIESLLEALLQLVRTDRSFRCNYFWDSFRKQVCRWHPKQGRIQDFFLVGGALFSYSTSTCTLPLNPPLQKAAIIKSWLILYYLFKCSQKSLYWKLVPSLPTVCGVANWNSNESSPSGQRAGLVILRSWLESLSGL